MQCVVDASVRERWNGEVVLTVCVVCGCQIAQGLEPEFDGDLSRLMADLREKGKRVFEERRVQGMRAACKAMPDMDPARYRPASESLIRQYQEKGFRRINPLVDANNLLSARLRIPLGIYDLDRVPLTLWAYRVGFAGEKYVTSSQHEKNADGKLVLTDPAGIFGSPVADSGRGAVGNRTKDIAVVGFMPFGVTASEADSIAAEIDATFTRYFHPDLAERYVVPTSRLQSDM